MLRIAGRKGLDFTTRADLPLSKWVGKPQPCRGMATLKSISLRLKSTRNMQKITQSMKMVSAGKFARAERDLRGSRPFGEGAQAFYEKAEVAAPEDAKNMLFIAMSSDRGLCGGIHSSVAKNIKSQLQNSKNASDAKIICVGDKLRGQLYRLFGNNILLTCKELGRLPPQFGDAAKIAAAVLDTGFEFDAGGIIYNKFKTVVSYYYYCLTTTTTELPIYSLQTVSAAPKLTVYDSLDADIIQCYLEYSLVAQLYYTMKENACSEQSARMTAMDNASKNAGDMIGKLELQFNRTRQAAITRELIEIISGASAI
ncbi:LOW QUALITY PROTEIN: ATP synthase subunit gamma, mitochondrial-like [Folsomia candida]|uniref:LOW QUALITY PROTEIN: ATP synthase subunit gamma, mitochondrial-like n=1 Tax=Folsomia candida TaxID=158441 RepID=UPI001604E642|nr:LOW QUALITY PROTEIN: ATP synthase subunit gamma, mitochondrial-like [Folsomia candida]